MDRLDDALRKALRREDPGPDFTARVLARAQEQSPAPGRRRGLFEAFRLPNFRWAAAAAMVCVMVAAGVEYHERQTRIEGEAAKEKLVTALKIAGTKLNLARDKVQQLNAENQRGE